MMNTDSLLAVSKVMIGLAVLSVAVGLEPAHALEVETGQSDAATPGQSMSSGALPPVELPCQPEQMIRRSLPGGGQWEFCWESRVRENLVLRALHYTSPQGVRKHVLATASLGQLHVAYDDSDVTYSDVTQYGLGGAYMQELGETDCAYGERLYVNSRAAACLWTDRGRHAPGMPATSSLNIYSISQVGAYTYIINWRLHADGSIEPGIGATGALQRSSTQVELPFGRILGGDTNTVWLSHTHNYYWRLDFDLGESATDDQVTEHNLFTSETGQGELRVTHFDTEAARRIDPLRQRGWSIHETQADGYPSEARWQIDPYHYGQRFVRPLIEPFTEYDFFVTVANDCERFASQNARFNPDCRNHVLEYANDEPLTGQDLVVWHRVSFHHVPRNEDQPHMHSHWDGFVIRPIGVFQGDLSNNTPPLMSVSDLDNRIGDRVELQILADDIDGDALTFRVAGLPDGVQSNENGRVTGTLDNAGQWQVEVQVSDGRWVEAAQFVWTVENARKSKRGIGAVPPLTLLLLALIAAARFACRWTEGRTSVGLDRT